eukprot:646200-Rhodomonas_salina.1
MHAALSSQTSVTLVCSYPRPCRIASKYTTVFCDRDRSFMHDYCGRTHARMDGALGGPGDGGVGRAVVVPDVERDVYATDWFPDSQGQPG